MTVRVKLLSGLKKTRNALVGLSSQRLQSTSVQHAAADGNLDTGLEQVVSVKPYSQVPGPRELPLIGNAWRFLPYIGKWEDFKKLSENAFIGLETSRAYNNFFSGIQYWY
jgi:cytochrome P450 family 49 subfamily A